MSENIDYQKRQEEVLAWLKAKGKPEPKTWNYHQADDGRYYYFQTEKKKRFGELGACEYCNREYLKYVGKFCTKLCSELHSRKRILLTCEECKIKFERVPSDVADNVGDLFFCNNICYHSALKKASLVAKYRIAFYKKYGISNKKYKIFKKSKCLDCNIQFKGLLHVHHIDGNRINNNALNLETLCFNHHAIRHLTSDLEKNFKFLTDRLILKNIDLYNKKEKKVFNSKSIISNKKLHNELKLSNTSNFSMKKNILQDGEKYFFYKRNKKLYGLKMFCQECNTPYVKTNSDLSNFCSKFCSNKNKRSKNCKKIKCAHCETVFERKISKIRSELMFCNKDCQAAASKKGGVLVKSHYNDNIGYREKAFKYLANKCADCEVCFEPILDVHHKDGNHDNNDINNLEILCPNHHATRHMRQDDKGEWIYSTKSLTPRDKLEEVKRDLGI